MARPMRFSSQLHPIPEVNEEVGCDSAPTTARIPVSASTRRTRTDPSITPPRRATSASSANNNRERTTPTTMVTATSAISTNGATRLFYNVGHIPPFRRLIDRLQHIDLDTTTVRSYAPNHNYYQHCLEQPHPRPRPNVLSTTRQQLFRQHNPKNKFSLKTQTDKPQRVNVGVAVDLDNDYFTSHRTTNIPTTKSLGMTHDKCTQMFEHVSSSELYCMEWVHKYLFDVHLDVNMLVVDDKLRNSSEFVLN